MSSGNCTRCEKPLNGEGLYFCNPCLEIKSIELLLEQADMVVKRNQADLDYELHSRNRNDLLIANLEAKVETHTERADKLRDQIAALDV